MKVSQPAPAFDLEAYANGKIERVRSDQYKGKWLVLFFYPRDFTFVCPTELKALAAHQKEFEAENAQLIAASTDSAYSHQAWFSRDLPEVKYPVLADTGHQLAREYGILLEKDGTALRGTFIIDPDGIVQYSVVSSLNVGRSSSETLRVLQALKSGGLCPIDWKKGDKNL
ncbi:Peroxiredoxin [uncultured archaeon]|nr:Peroxiredoxin [uncultured archaeon]